jgi:hypothetical protein
MLVKYWSNTGQIAAPHNSFSPSWWQETGSFTPDPRQAASNALQPVGVVKYWSNTDQILVKYCSNTG